MAPLSGGFDPRQAALPCADKDVSGGELAAVNVMAHLEWHGDHFNLAGYTFRLQQGVAGDTADDAFLFYKSRSQVEQFGRFLEEADFMPATVLELGIWDGGSAAFWVETLGLKQYAAIDLQTRGDAGYYRRWHAERGEGVARTYWGVDQTDAATIGLIISRHQLEPLDLVLDDCSHQFDCTRESFEFLFNRLRPGGWYIIEDWAWALQPEFQRSEHPWGPFPAMHPLIHRIVDLHGGRPDLIPSVKVYPDFVAVERGAATAEPFVLRDLIPRRARPWTKVALRRIRGQAGRVRRQVSRSGPS